MKRQWKFACYSLVLVLSTSFTAHSELLADARDVSVASKFFIVGKITNKDADDFEAAMAMRAKRKISPPSLGLNSDGGNLAAAMRIGRTARKYQVGAVVFNWNWKSGSPYVAHRCMSACVFILAGAVRRLVFDDPIGIHRPYRDDTEETTAIDGDREFKDLAKHVRAYLEEMNMPPSLAEDILRVPPGQVKILTGDELRKYMLNGTDPVEEEIDTAQEARKYGVTKQEYMRRLSQAMEECDPHRLVPTGGVDAFDKCWKDTLTGKR